MSRLVKISSLFSGVMSLTQAQLTWTSCGTGLDCTSLSVPLEWANTSTSKDTASIALVRYNATVDASQRLGSLLVNPGGPGASGVGFVQAGAAAFSALTGGLYDIIGFDPRGVGSSTPFLECFENAGAEYNFSSTFPSAPNLWLGSFSNASYNADIKSAITEFDTQVKGLADACVAQKSQALYTSTTAYVARDMAAIVDALDGEGSKLNYWAFSYGTIHLVEFIQNFPHRVGRIVADGVFDAEANALTYVAQLPNDQVSVRDALNDFISFCEKAGATNCPLSVPPSGVTGTLTQRLDALFSDLFHNPIDYSGFPISLDVLSPFLWSFQRLPPTWSKLANILLDLESRNATLLMNVLAATSAAEPSDASAAGTGILNTYPLQCLDNADSTSISVSKIISLTKSISLAQNTPLLSADLTPLSFCRHFPATRPQVPNLGVSLMANTNALLAKQNITILIINPDHDPVTPLSSAKHLRSLLPSSSVLAVRGGSGHTSVSTVSLGAAEAIYEFFVEGSLPKDGVYMDADQSLFPAGAGKNLVEGEATYVSGRTYTEVQKGLMDAVYGVFLSFLAIG
jgi:pimeloyl-ACP methyl ester carboxylesterase